MKKDDDFEKVVENFVTPLSKLYNKNLNEAQIQAFVEDLSRFTKPELLGAQLTIRRKNKYFPTISEAITACEALREREKKNNESASNPGKNPWQNIKDERKKMIAEYIDKFKLSNIWFEAVNGKWDLSLWRFIYSVADVQAQMIQGRKNIGWNKPDIFGIDYALTDEEKASWFKIQRAQCQGGIDVAIPTTRIAEWKRDAGVDKAAA